MSTKTENLIVISAHAEGYRSGAIEYEECYLTQEFYDSIKDSINISVWVSELDGKHSECEADIEIKTLKNEEINNFEFEFCGCERIVDCLYEFSDESYEIVEAELKKAKDIIKNLDTTISYEFKAKKSQRKLVAEFIKTLNI